MPSSSSTSRLVAERLRARARRRRSSGGCRRRANSPVISGSSSRPTTAPSCVASSRTVTLRAAADVHGEPVGAVVLERERERARDVAHRDEVAALQPVLEDPRRPVVQQPRREDREHAGVRIRERLPRAVRVEEPQRDRRDPVRRAGDEAGALLVVLRERVDRREARPLALRRRHRLEPRVVPLARCELLARALRRLDLAARCRRGRAPRRRCSCSTRRRAFARAAPRAPRAAPRSRASSPTCTPRARTSTARRRRAPRDARRSRRRRARARSASASRTSPADELDVGGEIRRAARRRRAPAGSASRARARGRRARAARRRDASR